MKMETTESSTHCDLCGDSNWHVISQLDRHGHPLTTGLCARCGVVAHLPLPDEATIARYYAEEYRSDYHGEVVPAARRVMRAWNNGQRIHQMLAPFLPSQGSVFEVGAGLGCTVKAFAHHGFRARGIEPNRDFNRYSRQQLRADVANRNLYDLTDPVRHDLALLVHVIEHFRSPRSALMKLRELIVDDGLLYIECPNLAAPFATFERMFHFAHIYNFTPTTLRELAASCGFDLVAQLHDAAHPDIALLLRKGELPDTTEVDEAEPARVRHAIHRYSTLSYHLRGNYLQRRLTKLVNYGRERLCARAFVQNLMLRCANDPLPEQPPS
ncbi:MAG: class I SAM-dependent methyltransferase [Mariprofundales bacterium]|nr:class I SAM-dependent methyltransferase [Mariprofundales bacterium]